MSNNRNDISQIRKYLSGELDGHAMHELERQALDDPFLMDALQGYEHSRNQQANLHSLNDRLQQRIARKSKRIVLWPAIATAATVLLFAAAGGWWLLQKPAAIQQPAQIAVDKTQVSKKPLAPPAQAPSVQQEIAVLKPAPPARTIRPEAPLVNKMEDEQKASSPLASLRESAAAPVVQDSLYKEVNSQDAAASAYTLQRKPDVTGSVSKVTPEALENRLAGRAAGVMITPAAKKGQSEIKIVTGQVLSGSDKEPLPGVSITIAGKKIGTQTGVDGRFRIEASGKDELLINYIGYKAQQIKIKGKDNLTIKLAEMQAALSEVVIVGYGTSANKEKAAHPSNGWEDFKQYLKEDAKSADGKKGLVRLTFVVNPDNTLSNFKITRSLSLKNDEAAINLIKEGPSWIHNLTGKPETIKIKINFE